jgi:hypothetical protein
MAAGLKKIGQVIAITNTTTAGIIRAILPVTRKEISIISTMAKAVSLH